jgi:hypothetical protein
MTQTQMFDDHLPRPRGSDVDRILEAFGTSKPELIAEGRRVALEIWSRQGHVTSVEVVKHMREHGWADAIGAVDPRWVGAVFRLQGWEPIATSPTGSHRRPVTVWGRP